jgi:hypothetical protein
VATAHALKFGAVWKKGFECLGAESPVGFQQVLQQLAEYRDHRNVAEAAAVQAAEQCCEPHAPLIYWLLKRLPIGAPPVTLPPGFVALDTQKLHLFSGEVAGMVVAAALQAVHLRHWAPPSKVCNCATGRHHLRYAFAPVGATI